MSLDLATMKRRRTAMIAVNAIAALGALAGVVGYFQYGKPWALIVFVGALLLGFGAQIWFIVGLRGPSKGA